MAHKSQIRARPKRTAVPRVDVVPPETPAPAEEGLTALLESVMKPILAVTYWFDPAPSQAPYPVTVRFSGRHVDVKGRLKASDRFVHDENIERVIPGSGPISVTARIHDVSPGEWAVTAQIVGAAQPAHEAKKHEAITSVVAPRHPLARLWNRWAPSVESTEKVSTCLTPFAHVPGIFPGVYAVMVGLGMIIALLLQGLVVSGKHLAAGPWWVITLSAIVTGVIVAKVWYIVTYRREHLKNGWCIQGFITGATLAAALLLLVFHVAAGVFLDAAAPGLLLAMGVGRIGCFFAGCCGGPLTASRLGVWSSDQRVGARRIPTQLMESALASLLGVGTLIAILVHGTANGAFFVGGLAAYTLVRQGILHLRAEPRKSKLGLPITATLAALVFVGAVVFLIR